LSGEDADDRLLLERTRAEELRLVTHMVASSRVSLLYSTSGNGKTSLIQAGVLPFFQRQGYATFRTRPRPPWSQGDPTLAFRECLLRDLQGALVNARDERLLKTLEQLVGEAPAAEREDLKALLKRLQVVVRAAPGDDSQLEEGIRAQLPGVGQTTLPELLSRISDLLGRDRRLLVVCDQFEELFVHYGRNRTAVEKFVDELGTIWADTSLPIHLLFSMREDWVGSMIAFRRQIPEIFRNYFRLSPIRRSVAAQALSLPLVEEGKTFALETVDRILGDLIVCYARSQGDESAASPEPEEDQFLELPALQVVSERIWETRHAQEQPFSLAHYLSLADGARPEVSPAQQALDSYLQQMLAQLPGEKPEPARDELRLDCLYLLTDRERHRRASTLARIERELRQIRPSELDLPQPSSPEIRNALELLVDARLVRRLDAGAEGEEYELAHDFEVRAVLGTWRKLDRERTRALGRLSIQRKAKDERLAELERKAKDERLAEPELGQKLMLDLLKTLPFLGLAGLLWAATVLWWRPTATPTLAASPLFVPFWLIEVSFGLAAVLAVLARHRRSLLLCYIGVPAGIVILIGTNVYRTSVLKVGLAASPYRSLPRLLSLFAILVSLSLLLLYLLALADLVGRKNESSKVA